MTGRPRRPGSSARSSKATRLFRARSHHDAGQARDEPGPFDPKGSAGVGPVGPPFTDKTRTGAASLRLSLLAGGRSSGHRTISTFLRYDIASEEDKREALRKVEARVAAEAGKHSNVVSIRKHGENTENRGSEGRDG